MADTAVSCETSPSLKAPAALEAVGITKSFSGQLALDDFDLKVEQGEVHALVGENGSGKSTFIKVLAGYHAPDAGKVSVAGESVELASPQAAIRAGCRFVHQELGLVESLSVADNLQIDSGFPSRFGTLKRKEVRQRSLRLLEAAGVSLDPRTLVAGLSPAMKTGVALARAVHSDSRGAPRLLVFDEPTATLSADDTEMLMSIIRRIAHSGAGVIYVTHRLAEVFDVSNRITVLRDGRKVATANTSELQYKDLVHLLVGGELDEAKRARAEAVRPQPETALRIENLTDQAIHDVAFDVRKGEILGFAGITGSGRESVLAALFSHKPFSGAANAHDRPVQLGVPRSLIDAGITYLPADRKNLSGHMTLSSAENLLLADSSRHWRRLIYRRRAEDLECERWFSELDIRPRGGYRLPLSALSGGNQQKLLLAKWLRIPLRVLMLDEPTQGVDIGAKGQLHQQLIDLARSGVAVVVSSSDLEEICALCSRVLVMREGRMVTELSADELTVQKLSRACLTTEVVDSEVST